MDNLRLEKALASELANIADELNENYYSKKNRASLVKTKQKGKLLICFVASAAAGIIWYSFVHQLNTPH